jgi:hypothetical protein
LLRNNLCHARSLDALPRAEKRGNAQACVNVATGPA